MRKKHRRPKPHTIVWACLPEQFSQAHYYLNNHVFQKSWYPTREVFEWLEQHVKDYAYQDYYDHAAIELKNENQFIMARLMFGVTRKTPVVKWKPRKRSHWRNKH